MLKRCTVLLLTLSLLFACVGPARATGLSKAEMYAAARAELARYFEGENTKPLEELCLDFEALGAYKMSASFSYYVRVLRDVELEDYGQITLLLRWMRLDKDFVEYLPEAGFGTVDELECYAAGRQAEAEGDTANAIAAYQQCASMLDSLLRMARLEFTSLESQYQRAVQLLKEGTVAGAQQAVALLTTLAELNYNDSEELLAQARQMSLPTPSPTPRPTATPSPTPRRTPTPTPTLTRRPTPTPTPRPTATPTPEPTPVPTPVLVERPTPRPTREPDVSGYNVEVGSYTVRTYANGECIISDYRGSTKVPTIPQKLSSHRVVAIAKGAYKDNADIVQLTIPAHIQWIGASAFANCTALQEVTIEEGLAVLEYGVFSNCTSLWMVTLPESIVEISKTAFHNCPALTLRVRENSYAHWYAVKNGIPCFIY